jgi:hypothetical protein
MRDCNFLQFGHSGLISKMVGGVRVGVFLEGLLRLLIGLLKQNHLRNHLHLPALTFSLGVSSWIFRSCIRSRVTNWKSILLFDDLD